MRGSKTTALAPVKVVNNLLKKYKITETSFGIIVPVKERRSSQIAIKYHFASGCHLLTFVNKRYKQEYRIYDKISKKDLLSLLKDNLGEQYIIKE